MNWLPSPPTDNLYKFVAISGLWLLLGLLVFFSWLGYLQFQNSKEAKRSQAYFFSERMEIQISARLDSIKANRPKENKLEWTPPDATLEQEQQFLQMALNNHRQTIEKNKDVLDRKPGEDLEILKAMGFYWLMPVYVFFAVSCPFIGFLGWYRKIQKPSEEAHGLDCRVKEITILKIEAEIRHLSRRKRFGAR